ncbi:MAG: protocatechuate 3,4-dioxygenase [Amphiplicatus sp.]
MTELLKTTAPQILGPFYPMTKPSKGGDLTRVAGRPGKAEGQILYVGGKVLDRSGNPVRGAKLEIWQANSFGRYMHQNDDNPAPLDPNFDGFAVVETDNDGNYALKTIKPGAYPTGPDSVRPPHIHFEIFGKRERLITQLYFAGDPHQAEDPWLQSARNKDTIVMPVLDPAKSMEAGAKQVVFDVVLMNG